MLVNQVEFEPSKDISYVRQRQRDVESSSEISSLIRIAQEVSEKRQRLLSEMKTALMAGQNDVVISAAKELCGLTESKFGGAE